MHRILFSIGSFYIYSYGVMIALAFIVGILLAMKEAKRKGENPERIVDLSLFVILGGIIGGRVGHVILHLDYYAQNWIRIFYFRQGGLAFLSGFILAFLLGSWYVKHHKLPFWKYTDIAAPSIALGLAIARIGCFLNGCCFGVVSEKYGIRFPSLHQPPVYLRQLTDGLITSSSSHTLPVIPTQLYSSLKGFLIFLILIWLQKKERYDGFLFLSFLLFYSMGRFIVEFFRFSEEDYLFYNLNLTQIFCLGSFCLALILMNLLKRRGQGIRKDIKEI